MIPQTLRSNDTAKHTRHQVTQKFVQFIDAWRDQRLLHIKRQFDGCIHRRWKIHRIIRPTPVTVHLSLVQLGLIDEQLLGRLD